MTDLHVQRMVPGQGPQAAESVSFRLHVSIKKYNLVYSKVRRLNLLDS